MTSSATVHVADHSFGIFDQYDIPIHTADWGTGLIVTMSTGAMIYTGIDRGYVRVTTDIRAAAPEEIHDGPWDDIVEASVHSPTGHLYVHALEYGPHDTPPPLPPLSPTGPGTYRLRAHARGRDLNYDKVQNDPTEDYLLTVWPAEHAPPLIIRATDWCGYSLRLSNIQRPTPATPPPVPPEVVAERQTRDRLHQAILKGMAGIPPTDPPTSQR
jgi:hypothetical protein